LVEWRLAGEKTCASATLSTTNPTCLDPGLNPARRCGKPATNRLSSRFFFLRFMVVISVRGWVDPRAIMRPEGLGKLEKMYLILRLCHTSYTTEEKFSVFNVVSDILVPFICRKYTVECRLRKLISDKCGSDYRKFR
jgi:hypothetical protein